MTVVTTDLTMVVEPGAKLYSPLVSTSVMTNGVPSYFVTSATAMFVDDKTGDIICRSNYGHIHGVRREDAYATEQEAYAAVVRQLRSMATRILDAANAVEGEKVGV